MSKENPALQANWFSNVTDKGKSYYTVYITFADYDRGSFTGRWGKNKFLGSNLGGTSGYTRLRTTGDEGNTASAITFDFGEERCDLRSDDFGYNYLYGIITNKRTGEYDTISFTKSDDTRVELVYS